MKRTELMQLTGFFAEIQVKGFIKYRGKHKQKTPGNKGKVQSNIRNIKDKEGNDFVYCTRSLKDILASATKSNHCINQFGIALIIEIFT